MFTAEAGPESNNLTMEIAMYASCLIIWKHSYNIDDYSTDL